MLCCPRSSVSKESACQCRTPGFKSWVRKIPWRRKWQPTPVLLPGKSHGQRSLVGYSPWGRKESDMTERFHSLTEPELWNPEDATSEATRARAGAPQEEKPLQWEALLLQLEKACEQQQRSSTAKNNKYFFKKRKEKTTQMFMILSHQKKTKLFWYRCLI